MDSLKNTPVLVLGLGESGLAMARWCARLGASVRVWDSRADADIPGDRATLLAQHVPSAVRVRGTLTDEAFAGVGLVVKSPGLSPSDERLNAPMARAAERGVPLQSELDLFVSALRHLRLQRGYAPHVIAITGTNGKTTTTAMVASLIERAGRRVTAAGNIGPTMLQTLADALDREPVPMPPAFDRLKAGAAPRGTGETARPEEASAGQGGPGAPVSLEYLPEVWVLELSSFQLAGVRGFEPSAATVLNISQDHLDWHGSMTAYAEAKALVFGKQAVMIINRDDPRVEALVPPTEIVKSPKGRKATTRERHVVRFGLGSPQAPGDFGLVEENGMTWLVRARALDPATRRGKGEARVADRDAPVEAEPLLIQRLMPADALRIRGRHNAANALAALALATAIDCPLAPMLHGLREYGGEPHRVQFVASVNGIDAFDDSKGTNVGATVAALNGLGADKAPAKITVILGGDGKGQDFTALLEPVRAHVRAVATIGLDALRIEAALSESDLPIQRFETLQAATRWSFERALPGDAVLLSPACASLDMFRDYVHRAEVFVDEVHAVAADLGVVAV